MWKDAPAALCEFVGVDPARKWAQCEKERDEWAALAGQYKSERDEAMQSAEAFSALAWKLEGERNELKKALEAAK